MNDRLTLLTQKLSHILQSKTLTKMRVFLFNNAKRFDGCLQLVVALYVSYCLLIEILPVGNHFLSVIAGIACLLVCVCAYKNYLMPTGFFNGLLRYLLLTHNDKVLIKAPDERQYYHARYLQMSEACLKAYTAHMREKDLGFSEFKLRFSVGNVEIVDLGAGLFARVPSVAIQRLEEFESTDSLQAN